MDKLPHTDTTLVEITKAFPAEVVFTGDVALEAHLSQFHGKISPEMKQTVGPVRNVQFLTHTPTSHKGLYHQNILEVSLHTIRRY